jgi:serine/threonine protein kinase
LFGCANSHPTLLTLRGFVPLDNDTGDPPAIVIDFIPNVSYDVLIPVERNGKAPSGWEDTSRFIVLYGTAVGMKVLHSKRIIHRDLTPANGVLNEAFEPCIADFGLSKSVERGNSMNQSRFGGILRFMAPEIFNGMPFSWSADVYAIAMLVYLATTRLDIFPELNEFQFMAKFASRDRPPFPDGFGSRVRRVVEACWHQEPKNCPTFQKIVEKLESTEFVNASIDIDRFHDYQCRVRLPD